MYLKKKSLSSLCKTNKIYSIKNLGTQQQFLINSNIEIEKTRIKEQ